MSFRLLNMIHVTSKEWGWMQMQKKMYNSASWLFRIWTLAAPKEMYAWLNLARSYAYLSDQRQCISALREATKRGKVTKKMILEDDAFSGLKNNKAFVELVDQL